jgi:uncharacterized protein (TIGR00255 family)
MPQSMTGFGQASSKAKDFSADVTVRSVNGKHLKTKIRLGLNMPSVIERIESAVNKHVSRGSIEIAVRIDWAGAGQTVFNERIITSYVKQLEKLRKRLGLTAEIELERVALLPGAMVTEEVSSTAANQVWRRIHPVVDKALAGMIKMRRTEGKHLIRDLTSTCTRMSRLIIRIEKRIERAVKQYRLRLTQRVRKLMAEVGAKLEPGALVREAIMYGERSDIAEEICRMKAHIDHLVKTLKGEVIGRKLEFIAQEMHREANTMASKAADPQMTELIIDLRGEVDKIKEQVFNIE